MIVTKGTIQGDYAQKFGVGLVVDDCQDLDIRIKEYMSQINFEEYVENCNILLKSFLEENSIFEDLVKAFVYNR